MVPLRARVPAILAVVRSTSGNHRVDFVSPDFNAVLNITRCTVLKTRLEELMRASFVWQPRILDVSKKT